MAAHFGWAQCFEKEEYFEGAIADYAAALRLKPKDNFEALYGRGRLHLKEHDYYSAFRDLNAAIKLDPDYVNAYYHRAIARSQIRDHRGALSDMNFFIKNKDNFRQAFFNRGII